ncbi:hypothetical protein [Lolliginicoccus levis]|uniref:hypothetical protein n=1 Tax=Lolliginicoccus levis TaxID=2919542 RepID=UPI00241E6478|nr:hypothetical protein [Lolliginicoccus levis]
MAQKHPDQTWTLEAGGQHHRVNVWGSAGRRIEWQIDGVVVATQKTWNDKVRLTADDAGTMFLRFSSMGTPQRATYLSSTGPDVSLKAAAGLAGVDLIPDPGTPAAKHEDRLRDHPTLYPMLQALGGAAGVIASVLIALLLAKLLSSIDWPDLPSVPLPDLPSIPLPTIPLPSIDLPDVTVPDWVRWLLDKLKYVWPVILAFVIARTEVRRRRKQDKARRSED